MSPRPRQATGRPGTPVIPADWEAAPADTMRRTMRAAVELRDPADVTRDWDPVLNRNVTVPAGPYATDVPARVRRLNGQASEVVSAETPEVVVDHLITVPWSRDDVRAGHTVHVIGSTDSQMAGRTFTVQHAAVGSERFTRDLFCTLT